MQNRINVKYLYNGEPFTIVIPKYNELINDRVGYVTNEIYTAGDNYSAVYWDVVEWRVILHVDSVSSEWRSTIGSDTPELNDWVLISNDNGVVIQSVYFDQHTNILASGVSNIEHIAAFDAMVEQRFANLDIEAVLIYLIDTVNASALPSLAAQFDVLGYKGYGLAQTEQQKRDVIKRAIELHRYKGTPWSIKEALKAIGYYNASIDERLVNPIYYDGIYNHNGSQFYGPGHWADFRVKIDLGNDQGVTAQSASDAVKLILEYKNVRSRLRDVSYQSTLVEYVTDTTEEFTLDIEIVNSDAVGYYYDNTYLYSGSVTHGTINENITT